MTKLRLPLPLKSHAGEEALVRVWERVDRTRVRRLRARQAIKILLPLAAVLLLFLSLDRQEELPREPASSSLHLSDRSQVRVEEGSRLRVAGNTEEEVRLVLEDGRADFEVDPSEGRRWSIDCGLVTVEVVGTRFTVVKSAERVEVSVERGAVRVHNQRIDRVLSAGERFSTGEEEPPPSPVEKPKKKKKPAIVAPPPSEPPAPPPPTFDELMERADRARSEGRRRDAVELLNRAVELSDSRAGLASLTLGRLLAEESAHRAAASAFERAISLGVPRALEESAGARAFEAHDAAGDRAPARAAAARYLERHPKGRHAARAREVLAR
jgi:transmembrane sensor